MHIKKSVLCFFSLLMLVCVAQGQSLTQAPSKALIAAPSSAALNIATPEPAANMVASSPAPQPVAALPEAPASDLVIGSPEVPVIKPAIALPEAPSHRFFDKTNLWLHMSVVAGETSDLITTRRILQAGGREANPLARPLMRAGLGGQMAATYGLGEGSALLASYLLHRTGHHKLERFVPITAFVLEGLATASNIRTWQRMHTQH